MRQIFDFSKEQWGKRAAEKYIDDMEAGLRRLSEHPELLKPAPDVPSALTFYRVNKHLIVCDAQPKSIVVLTVIHSSMDIPSRLAELQPSLAAEVEILHRKLHAGPKKQ
jgi:toxin ParE1/3/4